MVAVYLRVLESVDTVRVKPLLPDKALRLVIFVPRDHCSEIVVRVMNLLVSTLNSNFL